VTFWSPRQWFVPILTQNLSGPPNWEPGLGLSAPKLQVPYSPSFLCHLCFPYCISDSDGSRSKNFDASWVRSIFCSLGQVGLGQPFMVWVWIWKISPKNVKFFNFFPFGSKKISSGRVGKYPGQRGVGLLFTAGQK